jgi:phage portal protein BeeE
LAIQTLGLTVPEKRTNPLESPSTPLAEGANWIWFAGGKATDSGEVINDASALRISAVFSCIRVLSEAVASLPLRLLRVTDKGREQECMVRRFVASEK